MFNATYLNDKVSAWISCHLLKLISELFKRWTTFGIQHPAYMYIPHSHTHTHTHTHRQTVPQPSDWLERLVSVMTCYVSSGTLNSTNSTQLTSALTSAHRHAQNRSSWRPFVETATLLTSPDLNQIKSNQQLIYASYN